MSTLLEIRGLKLDTGDDDEGIIGQGGMGVGIVRPRMAQIVSDCGGLGTLSSAGLSLLVSKDLGRKVSDYEAAMIECEQALDGGRNIAINIMVALGRSYEASIKAARDAGIKAIIVGAGLPTALPSILAQPDSMRQVALIPIVSSARTFEIIVKRWERQHYRPDAVVLEGPKAGGHLGFSLEQIDNPAYSLENLLPPLLDVAAKYGNIPVIVAGGVYTREDILRYRAMGAAGVQMGTRFLATHESSASQAFKRAIVEATETDIQVMAPTGLTPASSCGLPFRVIKSSPMIADFAKRRPCCNCGFVLKLRDGRYIDCPAKPNDPRNNLFFCICNGLCAAVGYAPEEPPLYTGGTNLSRVKEIVHVHTLMNELRGRDRRLPQAGSLDPA